MNETDNASYKRLLESISAAVPDASISGPIVEPGSRPWVIGRRKPTEATVEPVSVSQSAELVINQEVPSVPQELSETTS